MRNIRTGLVVAGLALVAASCASASESAGSGGVIPVPGQVAGQPGSQSSSEDVEPADTDAPATDTPNTDTPNTDTPNTDTPTSDATGTTTATTSTSLAVTDSSETAPDATDTATSSTSSTTTSTTVPELDVYEPKCVVEVQSGDSLGLIADAFDDPTVNVSTIIAENDLDNADVIYPGQVLDVCVDNGLDDVTGSERAPNAALADAARRDVVIAQQEKLNALFAGTGMRDLLVDGISGPVTQQRLCAARLALGLDVNREDMEEGSEEEQLLFATEQLRQPFTTALLSERWILIDRTCQIMFTGEGDNGIVNIFSTSTGEEGYRTRDQDRTRAYRFDPALDNGGWHNSTSYPVPEDNPLNGNMYKPLYFDGGQAIHGANNVPTTPQSKGCARLRPGDQDTLIAWLGLDTVGGPVGSTRQINVTVNVQGAYQFPAEAAIDA